MLPQRADPTLEASLLLATTLCTSSVDTLLWSKTGSEAETAEGSQGAELP